MIITVPSLSLETLITSHSMALSAALFLCFLKNSN